MSEDSKKTSGQTDIVSDDNQEIEQKVSYASHAKLLAEKKNEQAKRLALENQLKELTEKKLAEENQFKDLYESAKKERDELKNSFEQTKKKFAYQTFEAKAKDVALKMGVRQEALEDIIKVGDFQGVEVDTDSFSVDETQLKDAIAKMQKAKPYLFGPKSAASTKDVVVGNNAPGGKAISELTTAEIEKLLKSGAVQ